MKKIIIVSFVLACITSVFANRVEFVVDFSKLGNVIGNKVSNYNLWDGLTISNKDTSEGTDTSFVEYVQFMQATGGQSSRELFNDPLNFAIRNDYNFTRLINACKIAINNKLIPHIKFSIPQKLANSKTKGGFGMNPYPPDNYDEWYAYVSAICTELVKNFGKDEVSKWRFGVLTEFDNKSWFVAKSGDVEETKQAYFKLYDYTVDALQKIVSKDVCVGAHAMRANCSFWDATELLDHCANGKNYKTGKTGTHIKFFAVSYYDTNIRSVSYESLGHIVYNIRKKAESLGLKLFYGVDEGRILYGLSKGKNVADLNSRIVGNTYQAAYEIRIAKEMADFDIDYFSSWGYSAGNPFGSYPHISYYSAQAVGKLKNAKRAQTHRTIRKYIVGEADVLAGFDEQQKIAHILAYSIQRDPNAKSVHDYTFKIYLPQFANKEVKLSILKIDDSANYWLKFRQDCKTHSIKDTDFSWSPDSVQLDSKRNWLNPEQYNFYKKQLRPQYVKMSQISPTTSILKVGTNGYLEIKENIPENSALYISVCHK